MMFILQQALQNYSPTIRIGITEDCRRRFKHMEGYYYETDVSQM